HLISDVEPYSPHHLITVGSANNQFIAGSPGWGWRLYFDFNDIPGLQVANQHMYEPYIDQTYIDINSDWNDALGTPHFQSEYGYWQCPSPVGNPLCYGYWPYYTERRITRGVGALAPMVFLDNGKGAYYDYPYTGTLRARTRRPRHARRICVRPARATITWSSRGPHRAMTGMWEPQRRIPFGTARRGPSPIRIS